MRKDKVQLGLMTPRSRIPISLYVVATLFIISGMHGVFQTVQKWKAGHLRIPVDALNLFVGIGLLRRRRGWRNCALWLIGLALAVTIPYLTWFLFSDRHASYPTPVPDWMPSADLAAILYLLAFIACEAWSLYVLTRRDVAALFTASHERSEGKD